MRESISMIHSLYDHVHFAWNGQCAVRSDIGFVLSFITSGCLVPQPIDIRPAMSLYLKVTSFVCQTWFLPAERAFEFTDNCPKSNDNVEIKKRARMWVVLFDHISQRW